MDSHGYMSFSKPFTDWKSFVAKANPCAENFRSRNVLHVFTGWKGFGKTGGFGDPFSAAMMMPSM